MSEFILVAPPGWTQLDFPTCQLIVGFGTSAVIDWIATGNYVVMANELINGGVLPEGSIIEEAQLFNGETFMVKLVA